LGLDYQFDKNNKIELSGNINVQDMHRTQNTLSTWKNKDLNITSQYNTLAINDEPEMEWEASTVYSHQFQKEGHELQFEFNITGYDETEDNHYTEAYTVPPGYVNLSHILVKKGGPLANVYAEYTLPLGEETELQAGYVGEFFKDNVSYFGEYYDNNSNEWIKDVAKSNDFVFRQDIHALYGTLSHSFDKFSFMAGLRAEQALITSHLITLDSLVPNNYFRVYPTLHLSYDLSDEQQLQLNYSHRVRRPDSDEMNPFPEYSDPRNMEAGNPLLKPEQIHSIEFGYQLKKELFTIQPTLFYRYTYDAFTQIFTSVNDTVLLRTEANLSQNQSLGGEIVTTLNAGKFLTINLSANGYYNVIDASNLGYSANKSAFAWDSKLGANINITGSTLLQIYGYFRSKRLTAQGWYDPSYYANLGLRQDLFKNKASLIFTVSDVFNSLKSSGVIDTPSLYQKSSQKRVSQIVYLGFTYHFGKSTKKQAGDLKFENSI
jgi:outer membrane receptor protein involved in Fe transport